MEFVFWSQTSSKKYIYSNFHYLLVNSHKHSVVLHHIGSRENPKFDGLSKDSNNDTVHILDTIRFYSIFPQFTLYSSITLPFLLLLHVVTCIVVV